MGRDVLLEIWTIRTVHAVDQHSNRSQNRHAGLVHATQRIGCEVLAKFTVQTYEQHNTFMCRFVFSNTTQGGSKFTWSPHACVLHQSADSAETLESSRPPQRHAWLTAFSFFEMDSKRLV